MNQQQNQNKTADAQSRAGEATESNREDKMKRTFYAKEPGRYVQIERNLVIGPGETHELKNAVTGYKMVVDLEAETYDSLITEASSPTWRPYGTTKKISSMEEFWREVGNRHLVERDAYSKGETKL